LIARTVPEIWGVEHVLRGYFIAALAAALSALVHCAFAETATVAFDIPREELALALNQIARQSHVEVAYSAELTRGKICRSFKGTYTPELALKMVLRGSGMHVRRIAGGAVVIEGEGKSPPARQMPTSDNDAQIGEVVVTASKRGENQREVADSVTAFGSNELNTRGAQSFEDYIGLAPGVIFQQATPGLSNVTIRGVDTTAAILEQGQTTTGIYFNDIPLTDPSFAMFIPDLDTFDLKRVEVLRGPQGTLFGTATLGGAVNYISNPVYLDTLDAKMESSITDTEHSSDVGYAVKGALNLPILTDVFGVRVTAIKRFDPGYLDNIGTSQKDSNSHDVEEFRINALWQVNREISVSFISFYDSEESPDEAYAIPALGVLRRDTTIPEYTDFAIRINSVMVNADFDFVTLTLTGTRTQKTQSSQFDVTALIGPDASIISYPTTHMTTLEARLTSRSGGTLEWLAGVYHGSQYEHFPEPVIEDGQVLEELTGDYSSNETSEFGEATYRVSDHWRATFGGRYYDIRLQTESIQGTPDTPQSSAGREEGRGFSPKASVTYEPSDDLLTYALLSKGYRSGGVNPPIPPLAGFPTPATYGPDSLVNYELGVRPSWFDHQLTLDSTLFFINWTDIQLRLARPDGYAYVANVAGAHNFGLENALNWRPTPNMRFQLSATYLQAQISKTTDLGNGVVLSKGAPIPGAPHWSVSGLATYQWNGDYRPYVTVSARLLSASQDLFATKGAQRVPIMDYGAFDLRAGLKVKRYDLSLYVDNVADRRGVTAAQYGGPGPFPNDDREFYIRPRTVGLRLDWHL
jgi:iron complex outermembrane receptor protein